MLSVTSVYIGVLLGVVSRSDVPGDYLPRNVVVAKEMNSSPKPNGTKDADATTDVC